MVGSGYMYLFMWRGGEKCNTFSNHDVGRQHQNYLIVLKTYSLDLYTELQI